MIDLLKSEENFGINKLSTYFEFGEKIEKLKEIVLKNIRQLKTKNKNLVGYGAPAKATTALNYFNIKNEINYIIEDNPLKYGKFVPGVNIPIKSKKDSDIKNPTVIVLAWNFFDYIKKSNLDLSNNIISIKELEKN